LRLVDNEVLNFYKIIDYVTIAWFTFDLIVRFIVSADKSVFIKKFDNYIDMLATFWAYIDIILSAYPTHQFLQLLEVIRVMRLVRLFGYNPGLKVIITSLKSSASVLQLLLVIMLIASTVFGSFVYYAEKLTSDNQDLNKFRSIPDGLWYAVVSLTTIGYGDFVPITTFGRILGSLCVITGVLMIGLPMTIIVEIFTDFYNHLKARNKLPKQRRRILPVEAPRLRKKAGQHNSVNLNMNVNH
jgi:potassium voltage-gated channel Shaw-related subfamily C protein